MLISLFNRDSSGTIQFNLLFGYKFELDVKHSSDFTYSGFTYNLFKYDNNCGNKAGKKWIMIYIPIKINCEGFRISIYPRSVDK